MRLILVNYLSAMRVRHKGRSETPSAYEPVACCEALDYYSPGKWRPK